MKIHFIGIGGIGVSALAQYYLAKGHEVSGSDLARSEIITLLQRKGAKIKVGQHRAKNVPPDVGLLIYSPAVQKDNPELKKSLALHAKRYTLHVLSYPEALGELTKKYFTIAVSGTHGKSTTTAMLALILIKAGLDPTVIVGTKLKEFGNSNFRPGSDRAPLESELCSPLTGQADRTDYLVIEADEWQASFLNYWPKMIVLTNIDREHLDYYKDLNHILRTYKEYIGHLPKDGVLVANRDDKNIVKLLNCSIVKFLQIKNFSLKQKEATKIKRILKIPGEHNVANALAALTTARVLKIPDEISFGALSEYKGSWRRFEEKTYRTYRSDRSYRIISDYAHHPTEILATLKAAREKYPRKKIWCIFQPHQYQRTYYLFDDFVNVFCQAIDKSLVNRLIITEIYDVAGRENREIKKKVSAEKLVKAVKRGREEKVIFLPKEKIINELKKNLKGGEVVLVMGAGDIYKLAEQLHDLHS